MNRKLYVIDSITFVFGLALLFVAKGFGWQSERGKRLCFIEMGFSHGIGTLRRYQ